MSRGLIAAVLLLLTAACSPSDRAELPHPSSVDWSQYAPAVKQGIDKARQDADCETLQAQFDTAKAADLLDYIDASQRYAGC